MRIVDFAHMIRGRDNCEQAGYLGPTVSYDADRRNKLKVGLRLTIPLD